MGNFPQNSALICNLKITHLALSKEASPAALSMVTINFAHCLQSLTIICNPSLVYIQYNTLFKTADLINVLKTCDLLTHLTIDGCIQLNNAELLKIFKTKNKLTHLFISHQKHLSTATTKQIMQSNRKHLKYLELTCNFNSIDRAILKPFADALGIVFADAYKDYTRWKIKRPFW